MTEVRRFFIDFKKRVLPGNRNSVAKNEKQPIVKKEELNSEKKKAEVAQMRRTPDLIKSHSDMRLPPIPPNQSSCHGVIRGYPAATGHIYEEIPTNDLDNDTSSNFNSDSMEENVPQKGRGGVFYISPIDGALHRLKPERGNRIICPHLHIVTDSSVQRQVSFKRKIFGKHLRVCLNCAKSLRERFVSGEPDVIYPTYWRSFDLGNVNIPCPNLPDDLIYDNEDTEPLSKSDQVNFCRERRHSVSTGTVTQNEEGERKECETAIKRKLNMAAASADDVMVIDKLSCRATKCRLPEIEGRLLGLRANRGHKEARIEERRMASHKSMSNLLLSDILRRNHDRQCLVW